MSASVLVTDGDQRVALAVVRSLGRAGHTVCVCSKNARSLAGASRYASGHAQVPDALVNPGEYLDAVRNLIRRWSIELVIPATDESILALLPHRGELDGAVIPYPDLSTFARSADKAEVAGLAIQHGIAVPEQLLLSGPPSSSAELAEAPVFPLVVKPTRSVVGTTGPRSKVGVLYADNPDQLLRVLHAIPAVAFPVLLQRRIVGPGIGMFFLIWEGAVLARFAHRRIREKPPSGGVSVCCESVGFEASDFAPALQLLESLGWSGPAMVEFKQERSSGRLYLMEINGRFWGSLQLAIDAGVDFPALLVSAALGERKAAVEFYQTGVRMRWWWGEVDHLISRLRRPWDGIAVGGLPEGRATAIRRFLLPGRHVRNEVLRQDDPIPAIRETLDWFRGLWHP